MPVIQRILVPTDFSLLADHAAEYAELLAHSLGASVCAVYVLSPPAVVDGTGVAPGLAAAGIQPNLEANLENAKSSLADFVRRHFPSRDTVSEILIGTPYSQICQFAKDHSCDLIVVGSHARGVLQRIFLGSVSKCVLEHAPCPVLMVPIAAVEKPMESSHDATGAG